MSDISRIAARPEMKRNALINWLRRKQMRRILRRHPIPQAVWHAVTREMIVLRGLSAVQLAHLRVLTTWFLHNKSINGAQGLEVTLSMRVVVAVQACLLIVNLDIDYFANWVEVILYPGAFRVNHQRVDAIGLVHDDSSVLAGESWLRGPVILSWDDVERGAYQYQPGSNVVFHEFAHKLDGLNGTTNGMPPLPQGVRQEVWARDFSQAYEALRLQIAAGQPTLINPYASASPAEFFAVTSEYYFTEPDILKFCCPGVYRQLKAFYRLAG